MIGQRIIKKDRFGRPRKYFFDINFFKRIDTEEKAYFLGFLYADGCVIKTGVNLLIHPKDIEILEKFKIALKYNGNIELREEVRKGFKYKNNIEKTAKIRIHSKEISEDLTKLGCIPKKTFFIKFPSPEQVPFNLIKHFIRGYFDGDGCVYERTYIRKDGKKRGFAQITSTLDMVEGIKNFIVENCKIEKHSINIRPHPTSKGISILMIASFSGMTKFRDFLYKDSTIFLTRKKEKFYSLFLS